MEDLIKTLLSKIDSLDSKITNLETNVSSLETKMINEFSSVNKRLDGIDYELKKLNTVTKYKDTYRNIPA
ncbi:hypothetical protein [Polaribacter atrinae]|uniref:Uncharacterized protein n=1 Tax=Polaribacter atrinae TaxID=1333662 RepID=A0A176SY36_9FLAO|nr:hypothetical protein [Polaribacter atrinae]OAD40321.1 hypothetical protein LPB303_16905 [Polaribacter atrinae]